MSATAPTLPTAQNIDMNLESPFIKVVQEDLNKFNPAAIAADAVARLRQSAPG
jgi:hypothetical protein